MLHKHCKFLWRHLGTDYCHKVISCPSCGEDVTPFLVCGDLSKCEYAEIKIGIVKDDREPVKRRLPFLKHSK